MTIKKWLKENAHILSGKTIAITGSTGGLGNEICDILAELEANLLLLNRNLKKSENQKTKLLEKYPNLKIDIVQTDMQNFSSVKAACKTLKNHQIDAIILNAGAFNIARKQTDIGFDTVFQTNFVSPYYIAKQILPQLQKSDLAKVVVVGSIAHKYAKLNTDDIQQENEKNAQKVYGNSKRFLMFSLFELFKNQTDVKLSITHPGISGTNITSNYRKILLPIIKFGMKIIYMSPKKACLSIIKGLFDETQAYNWIGPSNHDIWGFPKKTNLTSCSEEESKKIFEIAEEIYTKIAKYP